VAAFVVATIALRLSAFFARACFPAGSPKRRAPWRLARYSDLSLEIVARDTPAICPPLTARHQSNFPGATALGKQPGPHTRKR